MLLHIKLSEKLLSTRVCSNCKKVTQNLQSSDSQCLQKALPSMRYQPCIAKAGCLLLQSRGNHYSKGSKKSFKRKAGHHNFEASEQGLEDTLIDSSLLSWSAAREKNALDRDFTVNSLMYDPFSRIVFDYTNGIQDCRSTLFCPTFHEALTMQSFEVALDQCWINKNATPRDEGSVFCVKQRPSKYSVFKNSTHSLQGHMESLPHKEGLYSYRTTACFICKGVWLQATEAELHSGPQNLSDNWPCKGPQSR